MNADIDATEDNTAEREAYLTSELFTVRLKMKGPGDNQCHLSQSVATKSDDDIDNKTASSSNQKTRLGCDYEILPNLAQGKIRQFVVSNPTTTPQNEPQAPKKKNAEEKGQITSKATKKIRGRGRGRSRGGVIRERPNILTQINRKSVMYGRGLA